MSKPKPDQRQTRFLGHAEQLEETGPPLGPRVTVQIVVLLIVGFLAWSHFAPVKETAVAIGQIAPSAPVQTVQHFEGGIIGEVLVADGERVRAGQPIARLRDEPSTADLDQMRVREAALALRGERLRAFAEGREPQFHVIAPDQPELIRDQGALLKLQQDTRAGQRGVLRRQLAERQAEINTLNEQVRILRRQIEIASEEMEMRKELLEKGLVSRIVFLDTQRALGKAQSDLVGAQGGVLRAREQVGEIEQRLAELDLRLANDALNELGQVASELAQLREVLRKGTDRVDRLTIAAPVAGIVKGLRVLSGGSVVPPGGIVAEIVPMGEELIAEVRVSPRDIGNVTAGQRAAIRVSAFDPVRHGHVDGYVARISASTFDDRDGQPFYRAVIALSANHVGADPARNAVLPGMTVQVDIETGSRSVLQYLIKPVYLTLAAAMRER